MAYILGFLSLVELIMFFILALKDNDAFIFVMLGFLFTVISMMVAGTC